MLYITIQEHDFFPCSCFCLNLFSTIRTNLCRSRKMKMIRYVNHSSANGNIVKLVNYYTLFVEAYKLQEIFNYMVWFIVLIKVEKVWTLHILTCCSCMKRKYDKRPPWCRKERKESVPLLFSRPDFGKLANFPPLSRKVILYVGLCYTLRDMYMTKEVLYSQL